MGLFSRLFSFSRKYNQNCESAEPIRQTRKVLQLSESDSGYFAVSWGDNTVTVYSTVIDCNRLRVLLSQGVNLPYGWQSVYCGGGPRINSLHGLVSVLCAQGYLTFNGDVVRIADNVVLL